MCAGVPYACWRSLAKIFDKIDRDDDKIVSREEWRAVVSGMLGFRGSAELLDAVYQDLDDDRSGRVHFDEIRAWLASTVTQKHARMVSIGVWEGWGALTH